MPLRIGQPREADTAKDHVTQVPRVAPMGGGVPSTRDARAGKLSAQQLRSWADHSEWVRAAINHRRAQVSQSEWSIKPIDEDVPVNLAIQTRLELLMVHPNMKQQTFRELIEPVIEDVLVLDAGVIEKDLNAKGEPEGLVLVDAPFMRIRPDWTSEETDPRYEWWPNDRYQASLMDNQIIYMMAQPSSHRVYGYSPLEALDKTIRADMDAAAYNTRNVNQTNPDGILNLGENVGPDQLDQFRAYYDSEVMGRKRMGMIAGVKNPQYIQTGHSAKDMQFMQWQVYLLRKIAAVFGIAPQDLGVTFDVNRANAQAQQEISEDRGLKPLLRLIEEQFNAKVVADFARTEARRMYNQGDIDFREYRGMIGLSFVNPNERPDLFKRLRVINNINLMFTYRLRSSKSARDQSDFNKASLGGLPWKTIDEIRDEDGLPSVEGGDEIIVATPIGPIPLSVITGENSPVGADTSQQQSYLDMLYSNPAIKLIAPSVQAEEVEKPEPEIIEIEVEVDEYGDRVDN